MHVQVPDHARPGGPAQVHADVDAVSPVALGQRRLGNLRKGNQLAQLLRRRIRQPRHVPHRDHHQVAVVVRVLVENHEDPLAAEDDVRRGAGRVERRAEDAGGYITARRAGHVFQPPRRPESFHVAGILARRPAACQPRAGTADGPGGVPESATCRRPAAVEPAFVAAPVGDEGCNVAAGGRDDASGPLLISSLRSLPGLK